MQQKVVYNIGWFDYETRHFICYEIVDFAHYLKAVSLLMKNSPTDAKTGMIRYSIYEVIKKSVQNMQE